MYEFHEASSQIRFALHSYPDLYIATRNQDERRDILDIPSSCFTNGVASNLKWNTTYEATVEHVGTMPRQISNHHSDIVSINSLPAELLTHIFDLVHLLDTCCIGDSDSAETVTFSPSPYESISHVCSYWRSIALGSPRPWSHIDLAPYHRLGSQLAVRAQAFIDRAVDLPLSIHISAASSNDESFDMTQSSDLYSRIANRAQSLALHTNQQGLESLAMILDRFLSSGMPGILNKLTLKGKESRNIRSFIASGDSGWENSGLTPWTLNLPHSRVEDVLRGVTDLELANTYFCWQSQAYHGLRSLSLTGSVELPITVPQLATILGSSPRLRSLHFGIYIEVVQNAAFPSPIPLDDLEVLQLESRTPRQQLALLQLLAPGPRALQMSIRVLSSDVSLLSSASFRSFVSRSKLAHLRLCGSRSALPLRELLIHLPSHLETLELEEYSLVGSDRCSSNQTQYNNFPTTFQLESLRLRSCTVDLRDLLWMHELNIVHRISAQEHTCTIDYDGGSMGSVVNDIGKLRDKLAELRLRSSPIVNL